MKNVHPMASFIYLLSVILIASFSNNPVIVIISVINGMIFYAMLCMDVSKFMSNLTFCFFIWIVTTMVNVLFSHNGETQILFINNQPITLEAFYYGAAMGGMIVAAFVWCRCLSLVMTDEKLMCVMGGILPKMALIFSMALSFIPKFRNQIKKVTEVQRAMGLYKEENIIQKFKSTVIIFSAVVTWSLENAVITGDSMKARSYGVHTDNSKQVKRTTYSIFKFNKRDGFMIFVVLMLLTATMISMTKYKFYYFPVVSEIKFSWWAQIMRTGYFILVGLPIILEIGERIKWKFYKSKI